MGIHWPHSLLSSSSSLISSSAADHCYGLSFLSASICRGSHILSPTASLTTPSIILSIKLPGKAAAREADKLGKQVDFIHFRPSLSFQVYKSNPQAHSQLCSRLLAVTSPLSLPPIHRELCRSWWHILPSSLGPIQQPSVSSPPPSLIVGSKNQEAHCIPKPLMATPGRITEPLPSRQATANTLSKESERATEMNKWNPHNNDKTRYQYL